MIDRKLPLGNTLPTTKLRRPEINKLRPEDRPVHDWYRFVLSYPPHLVRTYLERFEATPRHRVLDPFCGTGTTLVECKKRGVPSVGIEAVSFSQFASSVKVDWSPDPDGLRDHARSIAQAVLAQLSGEELEDGPVDGRNGHHRLRGLPEAQSALLLTDSISPLPLHKTLLLVDEIRRQGDERYLRYELLALAKALSWTIGNLQFGPEVGVGPAKPDAAVVAPWLAGVEAMAADLHVVRHGASVEALAIHGDSRNLREELEPGSVDFVITSPPYPNEKDYTRTTRLEAVLLGFINSKDELRTLKKTLVRSNTRSVYKADEDDALIASHANIQEIAAEIERRRIAMGKTSGFERLYARVTKLYFGGMKRHLADLRPILRPGAYLAYVVGDQASYLRVKIPTGQILSEIAQSLGYDAVAIDLFRTRLATATKEQLREEVVVLQWPG